MKSFFSMFGSSANELKSIRCITVTGILIAAFVVLDMCSFRIGDFIKINLAFTAVASVGMLFGPVPAMLAGTAGDLIGCIFSGQAPLLPLTLTAALEGFLYGVCLYKKSGVRLVFFSVVSRLLDSAIISLVLNTAILMQAGFMSKTSEQLYIRYGKTAAELVFFIPVMIALMPSIKAVYLKTIKRKTEA